MAATSLVSPSATGSRSTIRLVIAVAGPALLLALVSASHPLNLNDMSAGYWFGLHIALIPVFPLVGLAPWLIARRVDRRLGVLGAIAGYGFATFYTSLDVLAGVAAGAVQLDGQPDGKSAIYAIGRILAAVGVWSLIAGALIATVAAVRHAGITALPGGVLATAGAALVYRGHIYFGYGTLAMLLLAAGFAILAAAVSRTGTREPRPHG